MMNENKQGREDGNGNGAGLGLNVTEKQNIGVNMIAIQTGWGF